MDSIRQQKLSKLLQKELGHILQQNYSNLSPGTLVTVTSVRVSPDLSVSRIYVSIFGKQDRTQVLERLRENTKDIRFDLGQRVKNQMRIIPLLNFFLDDSLDQALRIDELLKKI